MNTTNSWKVWIDTGGTFTDCIAKAPSSQVVRRKVLSSGKLRGRILKSIDPQRLLIEHNWNITKDLISGYHFQLCGTDHKEITVTDFEVSEACITLSEPLASSELREFELSASEEAPILAMRLITQNRIDEPLPPMDVRLGSTKGTNALLEQKGEAPLLITTRGFADLCIIGDQQRSNLFSLNIEKPKPLFKEVIEVDERIDSQGNIVEALTESNINKVLRKVYRSDSKVVVIALLNSYMNPLHEKNLYNLLKTAGYKYVSASHQLERSIHFLARTETALVNAYLMPIIDNYLDNIRQKLHPESSLKIMTSSGGLVDYRNFQPKDSLLSGPAGGITGAALTAGKLEVPNLISFDMGGTSTDVSRYAGQFDYAYQTRIGDYRLLSPSLYIETVAAGGGSICAYDGSKLTVGPESAGASPGPACYGGGGPLAVTDINVLLGRVEPSCFGIPLNASYAQQALDTMKEREVSLKALNDEDILQGFFDIATEKMAKAIEKISVRKGYAPSEHALLAFGGAGGMHACPIASLLGMSQVIVPFDAGILSAYGIGRSRMERIVNRQVLKNLDQVKDTLPQLFSEMEHEARSMLVKDGLSPDETSVENILLHLRFSGQNETLEISYSENEALENLFEMAYTKLFGHFIHGRPIEVESIRLIAGGGDNPEEAIAPPKKRYTPKAFKTQHSYQGGKWVDTPVYRINDLEEGAQIFSPAILLNDTSTTYIDTGWEGVINQAKDIIIHQTAEQEVNKKQAQPEEVQLELFTNRFRSVVEDMGSLLERTAFSVNIKERLDFSCALLDAEGYLVVNAPHIPVHLGAMGLCARKLLKEYTLNEGDILVTNHPYYGGSHLPDVTLLAPVFASKQCIGYVANRAHHAEIGGISPGSMPANAQNLEEEGVVIAPTYIAYKGETHMDALTHILENSKYPTRSIAENIADLKAAVASIRKGQEQLAQMCTQYGIQQVIHYMQRLKSYAASSLRKKLKTFGSGKLNAKERLDDGSQLCVCITPEKGQVRIDFAGTSAPHPGNMNATPAIVYSAVLYVLRLLIDEDIPLNEGFLTPVSIHIPRSLLNPDFGKEPAQCPAVVGGNVEVSQRLVDTLLKAFGVAACSQGTMNNLLFGNEQFGFYETICGGVGATASAPGASAVHQHMTNTRITDPEIMELRYPVRVEKFAIRPNSGGEGKHPGGDGVLRQIRFLKPINLTVLSQHRKEVPYGIHGGRPGSNGEQEVIRSNGNIEKIEGNASISLQANDQIRIKTPGGGAWGKAD